jgi:hypothetical protein
LLLRVSGKRIGWKASSHSSLLEFADPLLLYLTCSKAVHILTPLKSGCILTMTGISWFNGNFFSLLMEHKIMASITLDGTFSMIKYSIWKRVIMQGAVQEFLALPSLRFSPHKHSPPSL